MLRSIRISNFRGHRSTRLDFVPITVIVGQNGSGKSSLLQAISFLMLAIDSTAEFRPDGRRRHHLSGDVLLRILRAHRVELGDLFWRDEATVAGHLAIEATFDGANGLQAARLGLRSSTGFGPEMELETEWNDSLNVDRIASRRGPPSASLITSASSLSAERHPNMTWAELSEREPASSLQSRSLFQLSHSDIERINQTLIAVADAEILPVNGHLVPSDDSSLALQYRRRGTTFRMAEANDALASTLSVLVAIENTPPVLSLWGERLLLLDEPELHLHPNVQPKLAEYFAEAATRMGVQIVLVTHSPMMAQALAARQNAAVLVIEEHFGHIRELRSLADTAS